MLGKSMAYVEKISKVTPIEGADKIELASVLGYDVAVKKGQFKVGDLAVFIEVDSELPNEPEFAFLASKKFRIKPMRLSKFHIISQGILFSKEDLSRFSIEWKKGTDCTKVLGIKQIIEDPEEVSEDSSLTKFQQIVKKVDYKLTKFSVYRNSLHDKVKLVYKPMKCSWADWMPSKSDEINAQNIYEKVLNKYKNDEWIVTEKLEGQNMSVFSTMEKGFFGKKKVVGVCTHSRPILKNDGSSFWTTAVKLELLDLLKKLDGEWWIRGEQIGPKIQKNIYHLTKNDFYIFDVYKKVDGKYVKLQIKEMLRFCEMHHLKVVPIIDSFFKLPETVTEILNYSNGKSELFDTKREGVVLRLKNDYNVSFKARSPEYLTEK